MTDNVDSVSNLKAQCGTAGESAGADISTALFSKQSPAIANSDGQAPTPASANVQAETPSSAEQKAKLVVGSTFDFVGCCDSPANVVGNLPTQMTPPYSRVRNQCSWFAVGVVANSSGLLDAWFRGESFFREAHLKLLEEACRLRQDTDPAEIQTLFHPQILRHFNVTLGRCSHIVVRPDLDDSRQLWLENVTTNAAEVKQTKLSFPRTTMEEVKASLLRQLSTHCFLGHRLGQAFAAIPLGSAATVTELTPEIGRTFLVVDSHVPFAGTMSVAGLLKWLQGRKKEDLGYSLTLWSTSATVVSAPSKGLDARQGRPHSPPSSCSSAPMIDQNAGVTRDEKNNSGSFSHFVK